MAANNPTKAESLPLETDLVIPGQINWQNNENQALKKTLKNLNFSLQKSETA